MSWKSAPEPPLRANRPWSLAARLTAWYAASAFTLVLVSTGLLYWGLVTKMNREDDEELADKVRVLRAVLRDRPDDLTALRQQAEWGWAARQYGQVHVRILDDRGQLLLQTPGMGEELPPEVFPAPFGSQAEPAPRGVDLRSAGGRPFRVLATRADLGVAGRPARVVQVALDRSPEEELLAEYRRGLWLVLGLALVGSTLGGYRIARRGLRPVQEVAAMARRIRPTTLGERLVTAGLPAELLALADTFNDMLDRLEESFGRLAEFSANIAHELRTPVNNLRGEAEVALGKPRSAEEYRDVLGSCLEECARLSRLIDSLLFLARAESPKAQVERERVDLGRELAAVQEFYEPTAAEAGVTLTAAATGEVVADLNRPLLQRAVGNLVANALAHTAPGGTVALTATREDGRVRVEVADDGCGIDATHLPHLFDRFYRVDRARSSASGGVGLGLAIVKCVAELHGGSVALASEVGGGTRVALLLPARSG
jgi:two-component system heavy metal sensor histidine kinase CusS